MQNWDAPKNERLLKYFWLITYLSLWRSEQIAEKFIARLYAYLKDKETSSISRQETLDKLKEIVVRNNFNCDIFWKNVRIFKKRHENEIVYLIIKIKESSVTNLYYINACWTTDEKIKEAQQPFIPVRTNFRVNARKFMRWMS